jgi:hypothetical protein
VVCDLSLHSFDDPGAGLARANSAFTEMQRLAIFDARVRSTRIRRRTPLDVQVAWTVDAAGAREAFDLCGVILRTALHASGNSTAGWELIHPRVVTSSGRRRHWRRAAAASIQPCTTTPDWASLSAAAQRRMALVPALPPLLAPGPGEALIDLR